MGCHSETKINKLKPKQQQQKNKEKKKKTQFKLKKCLLSRNLCQASSWILCLFIILILTGKFMSLKSSFLEKSLSAFVILSGLWSSSIWLKIAYF